MSQLIPVLIRRRHGGLDLGGGAPTNLFAGGILQGGGTLQNDTILGVPA